MSLSIGCPRCAAPITRTTSGWTCEEHSTVTPLWRPEEASYEAFGEHLQTAGAFPTYLPWPLGPDWSVTDFAVVGEGGGARASMTCCSGTSALDGPVDVVVVAEEAGTGLGARVAGTRHQDPGVDRGAGPPVVKVRIESQTVPLWSVSTSDAGPEWDRSVVAGEANGRWLWLVLRPASAMLLLRDEWILRDMSRSGPHLVELAFGGPPPVW